MTLGLDAPTLQMDPVQSLRGADTLAQAYEVGGTDFGARTDGN